MIETRRLKNVVIFVQTILSFVLSRKIIDINREAAKVSAISSGKIHKYEYLTGEVYYHLISSK